MNCIEDANCKLTGGAKIRVVQGLRTIEYQNKLYAQGRTTPGPVVTKAKGGQSYHNYGLAFDFALLINDKEISWDTKKDYDQDNIADWMEVVNTFIEHGYYWGKAFNDLPHLEKSFGYSWRQLFEKYEKKDFIAGTEYVRL